MNTSNIQCLLLDYGGTLDSDGETWLRRFFRLYQEEGFDIPLEKFEKAFYASDDALNKSQKIQNAGLLETLKLQVHGVFKNLKIRERKRRQRIIENFFIDSVRQIQRNLPLLKRLASRYRLGIISNFYGNLETILEEQGLKPLLDLWLDSTQAGLMKPEPAFFQKAIDHWRGKPSQILMVGDSPNRDMQGAKGVGMPHVWLCNADNLKKDPCCSGDPKISSFLDLENLLLTEGS
ncbi:MAG: HAD family hydrolase [Deltaproteobacteria bacterium]|nr:HAD family hydrolase [Deltaproteobacteria bacterium]